MQHKSVLEVRARDAWWFSLALGLLFSAFIGFDFIYPALSQQHVLHNKINQAVHSQPQQNVEMFGRILNFSEILPIFNQASFSGIKVLTLMQDNGNDHLVVQGDVSNLKLLVQYFASSHLLSAQLQRDASLKTYELDLMLSDVRVDEGVKLEAESVKEAKSSSMQLVGQVEKNGHHFCVLKEAGVLHFVERHSC